MLKLVWIKKLEEVSQNMYCIVYSVALAYSRIYIIIYLKTPALDCIFSDTWS